MRTVPPPQGLYDAANEHDACGVAFVATLTGEPSHIIIEQALTALRNLNHRGASGADPDSGDGAGITTQIPDAFLRQVCDFELPEPGRYAVGTAFLPTDVEAADEARVHIAKLAAEEDLRVVGWRDLPTQADLIGPIARACCRGSRNSSSPRPTAPRVARRWSAGPSASASGPSTRPTPTSHPCRRRPWSTRGC